MNYIKFDDKEKIAMFDEIAKHFYNANFGQTSKSDFELIMFNFYLKKLVLSNQNIDGTIDYNKCSDYKISKDLGITQQRVRNLKVKNQLVNPIPFDWKKALAKLTENARYDKDTRKIILNIPDPNLYLEIQNFIEENGAYIEKQLNSKILQIRAEYYLDLIIHLESEESQKAIIKKLKSFFKSKEKENTVFDEKEIGKSLMNTTQNLKSIIESIKEIFSPENISLVQAFFALITKG